MALAGIPPPAYPGGGGLACVSLIPTRPEVAVQPVQGFADHLGPGWHVPGALEDDMPLVPGRRSEQHGQRRLRRLGRIVEIVSPSQQEDWNFYAWEEIDRFDFWGFNAV